MRARAFKISLVRVFAVLATGLAHASAASAATVTIRNDRIGLPGIFYVAGPGERNDVSLRSDLSLLSAGETTTISDPGAVITTSRRCKSIDPHTAICPTPYVNSAHIAVGDLDDRVTSENFSEEMIIDGGSGNDVLRGSDIGSDRLNGGGGQDQLYGGRGDVLRDMGYGSDRLNGGGGQDQLYGARGDDTLNDGDRDGAVGDAAPGPDTLDGGGGAYDTLSYVQRTEGVRVRVGISADAGEPGEHDNIRGIEHLDGGAGDDQLLGDRRDNWLTGGAGNDLLAGRGGSDELDAGDGRDRLQAGRGNDALYGGTGIDALACGRGRDVAHDPQLGEVMPRSCEIVSFWWDNDQRNWGADTYPTRAGTWWLRLSTSCPSIWDDTVVGCRGTVAVRETRGRHRLLARGSFSTEPWDFDETKVALALTTIGYRWATGLLDHAAATVSVRVSAVHTPRRPFKWTIRAAAAPPASAARSCPARDLTVRSPPDRGIAAPSACQEHSSASYPELRFAR